MKTKMIFPLLGAMALAVTATAPMGRAADSPSADRAAKLFDDPVIAKGKDFAIKRSQLDDAFINAKATAAASGVTFNEAEREMLEVRLLNDLIVTKLLATKATDVDRQRAREAAEKFIIDARKQFSSEEAFNTKLKLNKMTVEELRQKLIAEAVPSAVLEREMKAQVPVTDEQVKRFYNENPAKFEEPETVRAAHILIGTRNATTGGELSDEQKAAKRRQAEDLLKRAKGGEDFGKLARQYSEDPGSKDTGGEYTFPRGQMVPPFEAAAFSMKAGEISPLVTTDFGYHIIKTLEKKSARTVPLGEVSGRIKDFLVQQEATKIAPAYFDTLKKESSVEILDEDLKAADQAMMRTSAAKPAATPTTAKPAATPKSTTSPKPAVKP